MTVGADADRRDPVLGRIGGAQHMSGGDATHVVLGRSTTEEDEQVDALRRHDPTVPFPTVRFLASELGVALGADVVGPDVAVDGASFDSRDLEPGQLFVPLVAERDGHDFVPAAVARGAVAYLTSRGPIGGVDAAAIVVEDTAQALMDAARWARGRLPDRVVGVTGSVGKTSAKDLAAAAIGSRLRVTANTRSFNNEQGLPVTILNADDATEVLITEMGMRGFGEIARLCEVARPTIGVVTTVGASHTERVGGIEGVARAKRELVEALPVDGVAILNGDDRRVLAMATAVSGRVVTFGSAPDSDVRFSGLRLDELARPRFTIATPWGTADVTLAVSGGHMASNAAAAIAAAGVLGVPLDDAVAALETTLVSAARMAVSQLDSGALVINDAYNANPDLDARCARRPRFRRGGAPCRRTRPDGGDLRPGEGARVDRPRGARAGDRRGRLRDRPVRRAARRRPAGRHRSARSG